MAACGPDPGGVGGEPHQGDLPFGAVSPPGEAAWEEARVDRGGPYAGDDRLLRAEAGDELRRVGGRVLGPPRPGTDDPQSGQAAGATGVQGEPRTPAGCRMIAWRKRYFHGNPRPPEFTAKRTQDPRARGRRNEPRVGPSPRP